MCYNNFIRSTHTRVLVRSIFVQQKSGEESLMLVTYTAKKVNLKDNFKKLAEKKLSKFDRLFGNNANAMVKVTVEKNRQTVEVTIKDGGIVYRAENTAPEMNEALDKCISILGRQIRKNKTRLEKRFRAGSLEEFISTELIDESAEEDGIESYSVCRVKKLPVKPMLIDEAILRMNMVGHQFFMFVNSETSLINVVYKRTDGKYGLLVPEEG